ncbi:Uncharacterised protein [Mycobacteroides abscessus subsp. abscessus]|nr:Uncharacterised protein [Mycobacteroides abscessus subsp. abscessus]
MMRRSTAQPRICLSDAGTETIRDPLLSVRVVLWSSTTLPRRIGAFVARVPHSSSNRREAVSPALTNRVSEPGTVKAWCNARTARSRDLPTCLPAQTIRYRASDSAISN